jgi:hypothetical protein
MRELMLEQLGGYRELLPSRRLLGTAVFVLALCVTALLERVQFQLRATEAKAWWASNGRDLINAGALGAMAIGLKVFGFTGPMALAIAATFVICLSVLQSSLAKYPRVSYGLSVVVSLAMGLPVIVAPREVEQVFRGALELLF